MRVQSQGADQIREAMSRVSEAANQSSLSIREFNKATERLRDAVGGLKEEVARLHPDRTRAGGRSHGIAWSRTRDRILNSTSIPDPNWHDIHAAFDFQCRCESLRGRCVAGCRARSQGRAPPRTLCARVSGRAAWLSRARSSPLSIWVSCLMLLLARIDSILASSWSIRRRANAHRACPGSTQSGRARWAARPDVSADRDLLGLIAERVSDLITVRPDQLKPAAVQVRQAPYLGTIIQTDEGIMQLIVVEKVWDAMIQGATFDPHIPLDLLKDQ